MVKVSFYRDRTKEGGPVQVRELLPHIALNELILALFYRGFVEEYILVKTGGDSKADILRIAVTTYNLGPAFTPYLVVFEGLLETEMSNLGVVSSWFIEATHSASEEVLRKIS
ncbi:MAG: hypothetical protein WC242_00965 [Candidatus Paceibacterota bacterium]|jgi:hypothetical protein